MATLEHATARRAPAGEPVRHKNIVICSDGTGNSAIKGRGSNVFKLFEAVDSHGHRHDATLVPQVTYYDDGVGTENLKYLRAFAGATGFGLGRNVKQLYLQLVRVYDPGDRIFLFGFSRGAFTVRTLAGLIAAGGILDRIHFATDAELRDAVARVYREYRKRCRTKLAELLLPKADVAMTFADRHRVRHPVHCPDGRVRIRFVGVWDTVDAVGLPLRIADVWNDVVWRFKFKDRELSPLVDQGCHALAVDDERESFEPVLWDERKETTGRIEQVWFAGAHSNVGGGYPRQGMSLTALHWMMVRAEAAGLRFLDSERAYYEEHRNVDDKLYDPRAGAGVLYRWRPRDVARLCRESGVAVRVHASLFERVARSTEGYAPGNVPPTATVVTTGGSVIDVGEISRVLQAGGSETVHAKLDGTLRIGRLSYDLFLGTIAFVVVGVLHRAWADDGGWSGLANLAQLGTGLFWHVPSTIVSSPAILGVLLVGVGVAWALSAFTDARVERACSEFWHDKQPHLLRPLKLQASDADDRRRPSGPPPM